ncbi:MAG: sterol 3beta-glucosyltransferase, partial [Psychroserpens sp.]
MKIGLQTWGTDGDFMPFLALAIGLKKAGHKVTLAYSSVDGKDYSTRPDISGIELVSASQGVQLSKDLNPYGLNTKPGSFAEYSKLLEIYFEPFTEAMYSTSEKLCEENDLVIGHAACVTLQMASAKHNCSRISLILTPLVVQSKYVSPIGNDLGPLVNSMLWKIGDIISTRAWFKTAKKIRKREGISQPSSLQKQVFTSDVMTIVAASEVLIPRPADWKANVQVSGFLNLPLDNSNWQIPDDLETFLTNGEPPVYMTFGSCMQYDLENSTRMLVEAARLSGKRAIIQSNWENLSIESDSNIYRIEQAPHNLMFPRCA